MARGTNMPHVAVTEIHRRVDDHEQRLGRIDGRLEGISREMHGVRDTQSTQNQKLDQIMTAVATMQAHKPINSIDAITKGISVIKDVVIGVGLLAGGIIFLAQATMNDGGTKTELAVLKAKQEAAVPVASRQNSTVNEALARMDERLKWVEQNRAWTPSTTGSLK